MEVTIIVNGRIKNQEFLKDIINKSSEENYIICADGAAQYLVPLEIKPNLLVGDLDSIKEEDLQWMKEMEVEFRKFPARKDYTDSELAVEYALELNPEKITIIGAVGSRWDHSIGNVMLLYKILNRGVYARLIDEKNELTITNSQLEMEGQPGDILSIIPITTEVRGVTLTGLEYPLTKHDFKMGSTLGISNQFAETLATVSVEEGILLVCRSRE